MSEVQKKISITKPRRSATYDVEGPSGAKYRAVINKGGVKLTRPAVYNSGNTQGLMIPAEDMEVVIDLLAEAALEHAEQTALIGDPA